MRATDAAWFPVAPEGRCADRLFRRLSLRLDTAVDDADAPVRLGGEIPIVRHHRYRASLLVRQHLEGEQRPYPEGDKLYSQVIALTSTVQQASRRMAGTRLIDRDQTSISYPLQLTYRIATHVENTDA